MYQSYRMNHNGQFQFREKYDSYHLMNTDQDLREYVVVTKESPLTAQHVTYLQLTSNRLTPYDPTGINTSTDPTRPRRYHIFWKEKTPGSKCPLDLPGQCSKITKINYFENLNYSKNKLFKKR